MANKKNTTAESRSVKGARRGGAADSIKPEELDLNAKDILLDPDNPRLSKDEIARGLSQPQLVEVMLDRFKIEELAEAMISTGFLSFDPIICYRGTKGEIFVREGNRRLTAMKLLLNPDLAPKDRQAKWSTYSKEYANKQKAKPIRVFVYKDKDAVDVVAYIGFRHVTGVLQWPAAEKAKFIAQLVDGGRTYEDVARMMGSYPKHVERHYVAYQLVRQSEAEGVPGAKKMEREFGVLIRALQAGGVAEFLGVDYPDDPKQSVKPVPAAAMDNLKNFVAWTFGTDEAAPILRESRDLTKWGKILKTPDAVEYLKRTPRASFERAYFRSGGEKEALSENLDIAADRLEESVPVISAHKDDEAVKQRVGQCARFLSQILIHFPEHAKQYGLKVPT